MEQVSEKKHQTDHTCGILCTALPSLLIISVEKMQLNIAKNATKTVFVRIINNTKTNVAISKDNHMVNIERIGIHDP